MHLGYDPNAHVMERLYHLRRIAIVAAFTSGKSYKQIGEEFGITNVRARQIVIRHARRNWPRCNGPGWL